MNRRTFLMAVCTICLAVAGQGMLERTARAEQSAESVSNRSPAIRIETSTWSWRARGRVSFALEPTIRTKLAAAGLQVVPTGEGAEALRLLVEYREERGRQVSLDIYGTEVTCRVSLEDSQRGRLMSLTMTESPGYEDLSTLPYIDVIHRLETNPYFFFLGDIVRGSIDGTDAAGALIQGLAKLATKESGSATSAPVSDAAETLPSFEPHYRARAMERAVEELARLNDARARPLFGQLLSHSDWRLRLRAVLALDSLGAGGAIVALREVAEHDRNTDVREAARRTVERHGAAGKPGD